MMDKELLLSRRKFLLGTTGISSLAVIPIRAFAQTPTPSASPTPEIPAKPDTPVLDGDDLRARTSRSIAVKWNPVSGADRYILEYSWSSGSEELISIVPVLKLQGLVSNRTYKIRVRAVNDAGSSPWSGVFVTASRPPIPPPPFQETGTMTNVPSSIELKWNLTDFVKDLDDSSNIKVVLGREENGQITTIKTGLNIEDKHTVEKDYFNSSFRIALSCEKQNVPSLPSGQNISFWSNSFIPSSMIFAHLRFPQLLETLNISMARMRNYYG
jgi:hypothetical protein